MLYQRWLNVDDVGSASLQHSVPAGCSLHVINFQNDTNIYIIIQYILHIFNRFHMTQPQFHMHVYVYGDAVLSIYTMLPFGI